MHPVDSFPLANALLKVIGSQLDAGEKERELFGQLAELLWRGEFLVSSAEGTVPQPRASKGRLERLIAKALDVRKTYHNRLYNGGEICDRDWKRSLQPEETTKLHNAWMNDVCATSWRRQSRRSKILPLRAA